MDTRYEYRVVWKRVGLKPKRKRYARRASAERFMRLFGPEPWTVYGGDADSVWCCNGYECACRGVTHREKAEADRAVMPALEYIRLEQRPIGDWSAADAGGEEGR
jgi:hypothetical protein